MSHPLQEPLQGDGAFFFPVSSDLSMKVVNWGAALSYKFSRVLSLGISGGLSQLSVSSTLSRYYLEVFTPGNLANESRIDDDGNSYFLNLGLLVRPADNLAIGAIYKLRPSFELEHDLLVSSSPRIRSYRRPSISTSLHRSGSASPIVPSTC